MPVAKIPTQYYPGFKILMGLDDGLREDLLSVLKHINPALPARDDTTLVAQKSSRMPLDDVEQVMSVVTSLYFLLSIVYQVSDKSPEKIVNEVVDTIVEAVMSVADLPKPDGWDAVKFAVYLRQILSINGSINAFAKAAVVMQERTAAPVMAGLIEKGGILVWSASCPAEDIDWDSIVEQERAARDECFGFVRDGTAAARSTERATANDPSCCCVAMS